MHTVHVKRNGIKKSIPESVRGCEGEVSLSMEAKHRERLWEKGEGGCWVENKEL